MHFKTLLAALLSAGLIMTGTARADAPTEHPIAIVMHGGAGTIKHGDMTPAMEAKYRAKLKEALQAGYAVLKKGGASVDAVQAAIAVLEDSPLFNAGKGAVFTHNGKNELDSAIMDGKTLNAGAVAAVEHVRHPIRLAYKVMVHSPHVLLVGSGAEEFAKSQGVELVDAKYFRTERRWQQLQKVLKKEKGDTQAVELPEQVAGGRAFAFGTVGAVALDRNGNLAAGTSTGGLTNKRYGRVGDSPIIGAGTYADNATCGVSATGIGEYFMRLNVTHSISDLMKYKGLSVRQAADEMINQQLVQLAGRDSGGVIAMDRKGNIAMPFNTAGMYRGYIDTDGKLDIKIYGD